MNTDTTRSASHIPAPEPRARRLNPQKAILVLSTIMALQMTSFVIILPLFARRFSELGAGVEGLGIREELQNFR